MGDGASPVGKRDGGHVREDRQMVIAVAQQASHGSAVIETSDRRGIKAMKLQR